MKSKKKNIVIGISVLIVSAILLLYLVLFHPYGAIRRVWPNDGFSRHVVKETKESFIFLGSSKSGEIIRYSFYFDKGTVDSLLNFTKIVNDYSNLVDGNAEIVVLDGSGAIGSVFLLTNYYKTESGEEYYGNFCHLREYSQFNYDDFWGNPWTYANGIEDVKILEISSDMQGRAEDQEIDWYEIWPDLEEVIIYETDENGRRVEK